MTEIQHAFHIRSTPASVFDAFTTPRGLDAWWTLESEGVPAAGERYRLHFAPDCDWFGRVKHCEPGTSLEWLIEQADADWMGTRVGFELHPKQGETLVEFHHSGWPAANAHFRQSSYCWAMYLRLLRRFVESGDVVPYRDRLRA